MKKQIIKQMRYDSGELMHEGIYEKGGISTIKTFRKDGTLEEETQFLNGIKHGEHKEFHENGNICLKEMYEHGVCIGDAEYFYESGEPVDFDSED